MAKTSAEIERDMLISLPEKYGQPLSYWINLIHSKSVQGKSNIITLLKSQHDFGHVDASILAGIILNNGKPVYANEAGLLADQFINKEQLKPLYHDFMKSLSAHIPDAKVIIKKTYISLNGRKEFAALAVKSKELRLAMDLEGEPQKPLEKMKGIGCMPRISHMVKLVDNSQLDNQLYQNLRFAYERNK